MTEKILFDKSIRRAICRYFMKNGAFPKLLIINPSLISEVLGIYLTLDGKCRDLSWTFFGMDLTIERAEKWFRVE